MMLTIKELLIRNFRSFGDYDTVLSMDGLGPVLIVGQKDGNEKNSNGAGKTTLVDSIIWCLFGRVPTKDRPGDAIINWDSKKDCIVQITTCEGYQIRRTRGVDGHDDLLVHSPDGKDVSLSTNPNTQLYLNKLFNLDYDIFMASVFFAQFGKPFLEVTDQKRKKSLERMLHLTRFDVYAEVSKEKITALTEEQIKHKAELEQQDRDILRLNGQIDSNNDELATFETQRAERLATARTELNGVDGKFTKESQDLRNKLTTAKKELEGITTYDQATIEKEWTNFEHKSSLMDAEQKKLSTLTEEINKATAEKTSLENYKVTHDYSQKTTELNDSLDIARAELADIASYDITKLTQDWAKCALIEDGILEANVEYNTTETKKTTLDSERETLEKDVKRWEGKKGRICQECRQPVGPEHIQKMNNPSLDRINKIKEEIKEIDIRLTELSSARKGLETKLKESTPEVSVKEAESTNAQRTAKEKEIATLVGSIEQIENHKNRLIQEEKERKTKAAHLNTIIQFKERDLEKRTKKLESDRQTLENMRPEVTRAEAQSVKKQYDAKNQEIATIQSSIEQLTNQKQETKNTIKTNIQRIVDEANPYKKIITQLTGQLAETKTQREECNKKVTQYDELIRHLEYIRSSYSDRRKIKAHTLGQLIPYLNQRITYYLDALECQFSLELNAFLQTKSKEWPYDQNSGGERKRIDLALMFAIYDLHTSLYEQRCNILVLDEVDGRLDPEGINHFVNLLYKEFVDSKVVGKPRTILVISHKGEMRDAFPTKIMIKKEGRESRIAEVA